MKVKDITLCGILVTLAMCLSLLERSVPLDYIVPGFKLGFANIVTVYAIKYIGNKQAFFIFFIRVFLVAIVSGRLSSLIYSFFGGLFAYIIMVGLNKFSDKFSIIGISIAGSAFHHIGQILASIIVLQSFNILVYLPYLLLLSIPTGLITGAFVDLCLKNIYKATTKI